MTINDLLLNDHLLIAELAESNQKQQGNAVNHSINLVEGQANGNFNFIQTPEGDTFWRAVINQDFDKAYKLLIKLEKNNLKKINSTTTPLQKGTEKIKTQEIEESKLSYNNEIKAFYKWSPTSIRAELNTVMNEGVSSVTSKKKSFSVNDWLEKQNLDKDSVHTFTYQGLFDLLAEFKMYLND